MKRYIVIAAMLLSFGSNISAQAPQCQIPNTLTNGQVADATEVMDNFNAVAACVDQTTDDAVTHEGTPIAGEIAVFNSATGITGGDLTGDVTTSGSAATTLSATGVAPDTYFNATLTVDAKGRITAAANGTSSGSGQSASWSVIYANSALPNPTPYVDINVGGYEEVMVLGRGVTSNSSGWRGVLVSVDGGLTFFKDNGDYIRINKDGTTSNNFTALNHSGSTSSGRSFAGTLFAVSSSGAPKLMRVGSENSDKWFVGSTDPITHIRIGVVSGAGGSYVPMTGGQVYVYAR